MTSRLRAALVAGAVAIAGVLTFVLLRDGGEAAPVAGPVIARVNGSPIHLSQARARVEGVASVHGDAPLGDEWAERILESLIDDVIVAEAADQRGIEATDADIEAGVNRIRDNFASEEEFTQWLAERGMDVTELRRRVTLELITSRVFLAVTADIEITGDEVREYYRSHRSDYTVDDRRIPLLQVRQDIRDKLEKEERDRTFGEWLAQRREEARVEVLLPDWWGRV